MTPAGHFLISLLTLLVIVLTHAIYIMRRDARNRHRLISSIKPGQYWVVDGYTNPWDIDLKEYIQVEDIRDGLIKYVQITNPKDVFKRIWISKVIPIQDFILKYKIYE